jgi:hypothetical protein
MSGSEKEIKHHGIHSQYAAKYSCNIIKEGKSTL